MANERLVQLIDELYQATLDGRIRWQETASEDAFRVGLGEGLVRIQRGSEPVRGYYVISLLNKHGRIVDELTAGDFTEHYQLLDDLYQKARSSALKEDEIVDSMLVDLKAGRTRELPSEPQSDDVAF